MNETERLYEQYEDALFALLMNSVAEASGNRLIQKNEELLADPSAAVPEGLSKRCLRTIEKSYRKAQFQKAAKKTLRMLNRVALWILIPIFMFVGVFAASETVRVKTLNYIIEKFDTGTTFSFYQNNNLPDNTTVLSADCIRRYVPSNFSFAYSNTDNFSSDFVLMNESNDEISISEYSLDNMDAAVVVDTENADVSETLIGNQNVYIIKKEATYQITWVVEKAQKMIAIGGSEPLADTIMEIAKNIILDNAQ